MSWEKKLDETEAPRSSVWAKCMPHDSLLSDLVHIVVKHSSTHFKKGNDQADRDRVNNSALSNDDEKDDSQDVRDAVVMLHLAIKHHKANKLTMIEDHLIDKLFVALWNIIRDEDVEISINSMWILNLMKQKHDLTKYEKRHYRHVIRPTVRLLIKEMRRVEANMVTDLSDSDKFFFHNHFNFLSNLDIKLI